MVGPIQPGRSGGGRLELGSGGSGDPVRAGKDWQAGPWLPTVWVIIGISET